MPNALEEFFKQLSAQATLFDEPVLAMLCGMAALEVSDKQLPIRMVSPKLIGIWDWDVTNDLNHLDPNCADLFGVDAIKAGKGLPNSNFISAVHPDDLAEVNRSLTQALKGGVFEAEYRIVENNRIKRVYARGYCTLDKSNRPERLPGAIFEKSGHHFDLAPLRSH
jgi:PAS domain-containing protein